MTTRRGFTPGAAAPQRGRAPDGAGRFGKAGLLLVLGLLPALQGCSLGYYARGAWTGWRILNTREPVTDLLLEGDTDPRTRGKLTLVREALRFAEDSLGFEVERAYSTVVTIPSDTLAHVVSAAYPDRLVSYTWSFPIVGRVPYKGYFSLEDAQEEEARLADQGLDTWLRPTAAFSTLGYIEDPIPSTLLRYDEVSLVETILHELSHQYLFIPGQVQFNESFAQFVGNVASIRFFCGRRGGGPDTTWCRRAEARWRDEIRFSAFLDPVVAELQAIYGDSTLTREEKIRLRGPVFATALERFDEELSPDLEAFSYASFRRTPLNNATLLARMRYYHRLGDFDAFLRERDGDLTRALDELASETRGQDDPFDVLPGGSETASGDHPQEFPSQRPLYPPRSP